MTQTIRTLPAVSFTVAARLVVLATGLAASVVTARGLGVEGRGQYYALITIASIIAQIGNLGLSSSNTFLAARERAHTWPLVVNSIWIAIGLGAVTSLLVMFCGSYISANLSLPKPMLWVLCLLAPAILTFTLCSGVLVANERFAAMNLWTIVNAVLVLSGVALCSAQHLDVAGFVLVTLVAAVVSAVGLTMDLGRGLARKHEWRFDLARLRAGFQFASRAYLALLAGFLIQKSGVTLLAAFRGPSDIGFFSIAAQIADVLIILPTAMATVLFPVLIRDPRDAWVRTRQAALIVSGLMLAASLGVWLLGEWAIQFVFGQKYGPSFSILLWLMPAVLGVSVTSILSQFVVADGFPRSLVALWLSGLALSIGLGIPMVASNGAIGAAQAQSLAALMVCAGVMVLALRRVRMDSANS